ncbi:hypothetical protein L861_16515 [Litchfieldella anticariensis FP35 = DSM 16096]|uniref:Uncharacterized protein n=1 Tax=Litchfieldella anticariensis (strain DSM 16096 / CECT 5854 / CIP 108499 / LMG 22089 / FP35) TaxID=1121939 RepID=S2LA75_LITA3|nr:hypothetical protein L861_16515 [Halomonas anticariensis FP35 = DSM 16096]
MNLLIHPKTSIPSPSQGQASDFSFGDQADMAWSHERSLEGREAIAERLAFDGGKRGTVLDLQELLISRNHKWT